MVPAMGNSAGDVAMRQRWAHDTGHHFDEEDFFGVSDGAKPMPAARAIGKRLGTVAFTCPTAAAKHLNPNGFPA